MRLLPRLRAFLSAGLLLTGGTSLATTTPAAGDAIPSLQAAFARVVVPGEQADLHAALFRTILERVQAVHPGDVDVAALAATARHALDALPAGEGEPARVFKASMNAALRTLDPYTRYLDPATQRNERSVLNGSFGGVGLELDGTGGEKRVRAAVPGAPAARAGVQPGDVILRIDDEPLRGVPVADAVDRIRGLPGTPVRITLRRSGQEQEITVSLTRDTIRPQPLRWSMEGEVLVLRLTNFTGPVGSAMQQAIAEAGAAGAPRALVLDLRGNPGGLMREALQVADAFLSQGEITSLRGRDGVHQRTWQADAAELLPGVPMVVLLDHRSASASELVAAALQGNGRAKVMGQRSFGKGSVQSTFWLGEQKGALKLTTGYYHAPAGRVVQKVGVAPDIELAAGAVADAAGPVLRVDPGRCASVATAADAALSCALAYLLSGSTDAFVAAVAAPAP